MLSSTEGIVAVAAGGVALVALILAIVLAFRVRSLRASQRTVLGEAGQLDLIEHAARLEQGFPVSYTHLTLPTTPYV